ncbi:MAG TPA: aldo/keto reductase, partial [Verrucomicrobiae bacterium]
MNTTANVRADFRLPRREFVKRAALAALAASAAPLWAATETKGDMPYRPLGRTGERVSIIGLGGYHIGIQATEEESIALIRSALDRGVNFLDNCWDYNGGASEIRMGKALRDGYRGKAFLMSKIDGQTKSSAAKQIDESLQRLQTDHVDLMQFHEVIRTGDPGKIFAADGSLEAMLEAQKAGKVRFIGFTGHKSPAMHLNMLR